MGAVAWQKFRVLAQEAFSPTKDIVSWLRRTSSVTNEIQVAMKFNEILTIVARICRRLGIVGTFVYHPQNPDVVGSPHFIWTPSDLEIGTICVEVKGSWELSSWDSADPHNPPYDATMDFTDLVESQHNPRVKHAIEHSHGYMVVRVARVPALHHFLPP